MRTGKKTEEHDSEVVNYAYHFSVISHFDSSGKCYTRSSYLEIFLIYLTAK